MAPKIWEKSFAIIHKGINNLSVSNRYKKIGSTAPVVVEDVEKDATVTSEELVIYAGDEKEKEKCKEV